MPELILLGSIKNHCYLPEKLGSTVRAHLGFRRNADRLNELYESLTPVNNVSPPLWYDLLEKQGWS